MIHINHYYTISLCINVIPLRKDYLENKKEVLKSCNGKKINLSYLITKCMKSKLR